jgi:glutaredoxin-like protein NrdH
MRNRIITAREQFELAQPFRRRSMTAAVTLFTKPNCPQCNLTKNVLVAEGIPHEVRDVTTDPQAHEFVTGLGYKAAPVVHAGDDNHWAGFRPDRIRGLTG